MKRILSTLLVLFMCLGITACGNSSQKKTEIRDVFQMNPVMLDENFTITTDKDAAIVKGFIDRIDIDTENKILSVIDYKTGKYSKDKEYLKTNEVWNRIKENFKK